MSKLTVYRSDHLEKFKYSFADYYMNTVSINRDGSRAILSGVSARNGGLTSVIYILDFSQDNFLQRYEMDDTFVYDVKFLDNGSAFAVGSDQLFYININDGYKTDISFETRCLTAYAFNRSQGVVLSLSMNPDGRSCDLLSFDHNGQKDCEIHTEEKVISLSMRDNDRAILSSDKITIYEKNGNMVGTVKTDTDARKIVYCDKNTLYVLGKSRISKLSTEE